MKTMKVALASLLVVVVSGAKQSPFLKEILTGRCYFQPPNGLEGGCPNVVGYLMGILEGNLDEDITPDSFSSYFEGAKSSPGDGRGLFWLGKNTDDPVILQGWKTPETSRAGALMNGLTFCGTDLRQDCPEISGASNAFWTSAYANFAKKMRGDINIVIGEDPNLTPFLEGAIPNLDMSWGTSVNIYSKDCVSKDVETILEELFTVKDYAYALCFDDMFSLLWQDTDSKEVCPCSDTTNNMPLPTPLPTPVVNNEVAKPVEEEKRQSSHKFLFWVVLIIFASGIYVTTKRVFSDYQTIPTQPAPELQPKQ